MAEVSQALHQLGMSACPVCGSAESLKMGPFPVILLDGDFTPEENVPPPDEARGDLTFAVRIECTACGHLMLFNAQRHRTGDEAILKAELSEEEGSQSAD